MKYFEKCLELLEKSNCKKMRFGSVVVKNNKIIGEGFNHPVKGLESLCCLRERIESGTMVERCTAIHAEQAAILDAYKKGFSVEGADLYIMGKFPDGKNFIQARKGFYCTICSRFMKEAGIKNVYIITTKATKGNRMTIKEVLASSYEFATGKRKVIKKTK